MGTVAEFQSRQPVCAACVTGPWIVTKVPCEKSTLLGIMMGASVPRSSWGTLCTGITVHFVGLVQHTGCYHLVLCLAR